MKEDLKGLFAGMETLKKELMENLSELRKTVFQGRKEYMHPFVTEFKKLYEEEDCDIEDLLAHYMYIPGKYNYMHEIHIYKVHLQDELIKVTGWCDGKFSECLYITETAETLQEVMDFIKDVLVIEDKQCRTFKEGEELLVHSMTDVDGKDDHRVFAVQETATTLPSDKVSVRDAEGNVKQVAAKDLLAKTEGRHCSYCGETKLFHNHTEAEESWYCPHCSKYIYPWTY